MISWMIRLPCEITDQLAVGTQNCFLTLFYTPYTNVKTSTQNAQKCTIAPSPGLSAIGEGDTPFPNPSPLSAWILAPNARRSRSSMIRTLPTIPYLVFSQMLLRYVWRIHELPVCRMSVTLVHATDRDELFGNIFVPSNSPATRTLCIKILGKNSKGF